MVKSRLEMYKSWMDNYPDLATKVILEFITENNGLYITVDRDFSPYMVILIASESPNPVSQI